MIRAAAIVVAAALGLDAAQPEDPEVATVLEGIRARLRELCSPSPPGYLDASSASVPVALLALAVLVLLEGARRQALDRPDEGCPVG